MFFRDILSSTFFWFRRDRRKKCRRSFLFWNFCLSSYLSFFISSIFNVIFICNIFLWKLNKWAKEVDLVRFIGLYCRSKSGQQRVKCAPLSCNSSHVARNRSCLSVSLRFRASLTIYSSLAPSLSPLSLYFLFTVQLLSPSFFLIHSLWFSFPISSFSFSSYFHFCPLLVIAVFLRFVSFYLRFISSFSLWKTERVSYAFLYFSLPSSHFSRFPLLAASLPLLGSHTESHQSYSNIERTPAMETIFLQTVYVSIYISARNF